MKLQTLFRLASSLLAKLGFVVFRSANQDAMVLRTDRQRLIKEIFSFEDKEAHMRREFISFLISSTHIFSSASHGDAFAAMLLGRGKTFVDIGAWEPILNSETYALEKYFGWSGALIEPNPSLAEKLLEHRSSSVIQAALVPSHRAGDYVYLNIGESSDTADVSLARRGPQSVQVPSISWTEVLARHGNPDAVFIDIEGGELGLLDEIIGGGLRPKLIVVETLFNRQILYTLMLSAGYQPVLEILSGYNGWFVDKHLLSEWFDSRKSK